MLAKKVFFPILCGSLLGLSACGDEKSGNDNPVGPVVSYSSDASIFPAMSSGGMVLPTSSAGTVVPSSTGTTPAVVTPPASGSYATLATTVNAGMPVVLYDAWKGFHVTTMENETLIYASLAGDFSSVFPAAYQPAARVIWSAQTSGGYKSQCNVPDAADSKMKSRGCTVSEGIGYGMLLSYFANDTETFNRLWNYNRGFRKYNGTELMPWIVESFTYLVVDVASATDADLDIAAALVLMYFKTGMDVYKDDALKIINELWNDEIDQGSLLILSGNTAMWNGDGGNVKTFNLSYFSPVALRLFALVDPNHNWTGVLDAMYTYMAKVQKGGTGVFPDWSNEAGVAVEAPNGSSKNSYFQFNKESVRIPWRIAWDYYWYQDPRAAEVLKTLNDFIVAKSKGNPADLALATYYSWDLSLGADKTNNKISTGWLGGWCVTGIAGNTSWLNSCTDEFNKRLPDNTTASYFMDILLVMYSQLLNGAYIKPF